MTSPDGALLFDRGGGEIHRVQVGHLQDRARHRAPSMGSRPTAIGNGWWLLMSSGIGRQQRPQDRQVATNQAAGGDRRERAAHRRRAQALRHLPAARLQHAVPVGAGTAPDGGDKNGDYVWIGNPSAATWRGSISRPRRSSSCRCRGRNRSSPTRSRSTRATMSGSNMWSTDLIGKYDQATGKWTMFDLPTRGTETRYISLLERDGKKEVVLPSRARKVAVMTLRSEADLAALKQQAKSVTAPDRAWPPALRGRPFLFRAKAAKTMGLAGRPPRRSRIFNSCKGLKSPNRHERSPQSPYQVVRLPDERLRFPSYGGHARAPRATSRPRRRTTPTSSS